MKKYICFAAMCSVLFVACIDEPKQYENTKEGNFRALWEIIDTRYCYLDYKGINWDSVYNDYNERLQYVQDNKYELFDLFAEMLTELKDGHVNLYSSFDISRYDKWYTDSATNYYSSIVYSDDYVGKKVRIAGGLRYGRFLNYNIGYVYYGSFSDGFSETNIREVFEYFKDCDGLILDVRNNGGGALTYSEQLASYFFTENKVTGYIRHKSGNGHSDFSKPVKLETIAADDSYRWTKPVVVLTNRYSYSATNDFVSRMKQAPNAYVVGGWTGGGGGMPLSSELPNGWMVRFSACPMYDVDMNDTEWGIAPDYWVMITNDDKENNRDAIIDKAIQVISATND
ncbi:peptidase S41 [Paludibacter sp. 221]|uniref:S41 family peptidase n=1 Tax=Paludibacter sp. 221 TaxID=2302939 RepID=UPI0013D01E03|nr:S41 family peptidase [Paludibacter sp. 221]NDV45929.1 peptidase S41 [Paludibacter sp. 221]